MSDFLPTNSLPTSIAEPRRLTLLSIRPRIELKPNSQFHAPFCVKLSNASNSDPANDSSFGAPFLKGPSMANGSSRMMGSRNDLFYDELEFEDKGLKNFGLERNLNSEMQRERGFIEDGTATSSGSEDSDELNSGLDDDDGSRKREISSQEEDWVRIQSETEGVDLKKDKQLERFRRGKEVIRRSNLLAKQVISIRSAFSLGFVSQLWVDTTSVSAIFST